MRNNNQIIYLIVGASGSGKTTIVDLLEDRYGLKSINSYTTRPMRYSNEKGHIFISSNRVEKYMDQMIAYTIYNGFEYFATIDQIDRSDLYIVDPQGIDFLRLRYKGYKKSKVIFIQMPWWRRFYYMLKRGDSFKKAVSRIITDFNVFKGFDLKSDLVIKNHDLDQAVKDVWHYIYQNSFER